ncbi:MAG: GNAT family N-acetyltransferase [Gemmatimonadetes bacterium]|jgi:RimJ/RimL family protein N-acetyltransferase|nr:GNAT family N-acetyltransferase [Gemmatimonadota bacterium]
MTSRELPLGEPVEPCDRLDRPQRAAQQGQFVTLEPLIPERDLQQLFECSNGDLERDQLWTYLPYGPFPDIAAMGAWLREIAPLADPLFFTVLDRKADRPVGMVSFLAIAPEMRSLELGHIWYAPGAQRTSINTEAIYLMLCESFDRLQYRRVEWKCDALNERSRTAALRLGFQFEGLFRQHRIVKGRNRDTAWFSMLDLEWPVIKQYMETWLYRAEPGAISLRAFNSE